MNQSDTIVSNLRIVSDHLSAAKSIGVDQIPLPPTVQNGIDGVDKKINSSASNLEKETDKNANDIHKILDAVWVIFSSISQFAYFWAHFDHDIWYFLAEGKL